MISHSDLAALPADDSQCYPHSFSADDMDIESPDLDRLSKRPRLSSSFWNLEATTQIANNHQYQDQRVYYQKRDDHHNNMILPTEILIMIFQNLEMFDILSVSLVCKRWKQAAESKSLWKSTCFKLSQDIEYHNPNKKAIASTEQNDYKKHIKLQYRPKATVWILKVTNSYLKVRLTYPMPSNSFLLRNRFSHRLNCIESLNLSSAGDSVYHDIAIKLLECLPSLRNVDLSCCHMLNDQVVYELVSHPQRSQRLEEIKLRKCFGLSFQSLCHISAHCQALKVLDISDGSGAAEIKGLLSLFPLMPTSSPHVIDSRVLKSLQTLKMSACDYLTETDLVVFFMELSRLGPATIKLQEIDISRNFHVTPAVLKAIFSAILLKPNPSGHSVVQQKHGLKINVIDCDQIVKEDVDCLKSRLESLISSNEAYQTISAVEIQDNCRLQDHSYESVMSYLGSFVNS